MHNLLILDLPHVTEGQMHLEDAVCGHNRVLTVRPDILPIDDKAVRALRIALNERLGARLDYDKYIIQFSDGSAIHASEADNAYFQ